MDLLNAVLNVAASTRAALDRRSYHVIRNIVVRYVALAPRWYVGGKLIFRFVRLAADALPALLERKDFPAYLREELEAVHATASAIVDSYRAEVDNYRASPTLCANVNCGAPTEPTAPGICLRCGHGLDTAKARA